MGPSRKRGPPKGYIDAIEARLHQTEALLGILLAVEAERAEGLDNADSHGKHGLETPEKADGLEGILTILRKACAHGHLIPYFVHLTYSTSHA